MHAIRTIIRLRGIWTIPYLKTKNNNIYSYYEINDNNSTTKNSTDSIRTIKYLLLIVCCCCYNSLIEKNKINIGAKGESESESELKELDHRIYILSELLLKGNKTKVNRI